VYVIKHGDRLPVLKPDDSGGRRERKGRGVKRRHCARRGAFATQTAIGIVTASATVYGFHAVSQAIQGASVTVKGIRPTSVFMHMER
jgi:hypothetical protein